jgi:hypothetical protein
LIQHNINTCCLLYDLREGLNFHSKALGKKT